MGVAPKKAVKPPSKAKAAPARSKEKPVAKAPKFGSPEWRAKYVKSKAKAKRPKP